MDISHADKRSEYLATNSPEVDFALVLSRVIDSVKANPAELRHAIYELARIKLHREGWQSTPPVDVWEMCRLNMALETAIERVEAISSKQDELRALQSLDRLIENLNASRSATNSAPAGAGLLIDQLPRSQDNSGGPDEWPRQLTVLQPRTSEFLLRQLKRFSALWLQRGAGPTRRIIVLLILAVTVYATLNGLGLFDRRAPTQIASTPVPSVATNPADLTAAIPVEVARPVEQTSTGSAAEQDRVRGFPLPSVYGIYAVSDGKLFELEALPGRVPDPRIFMSAVITKPSKTIVPNGHLFFVAFRRDLATSAPDRVAVRVVAKVTRALSIDSSRKASIAAIEDAWAIRNVTYDFRVAPLPGNAEMMVMRPEHEHFTLSPGRYVLVLNGISYDFGIAGEITDSAHCLERTVAANGTFYSECRKP